MSKTLIVTHNAKFHADDVFAVATLLLFLGKENCDIIRTRDDTVVATGDYVVDLGGINNSEKNRFDHHQKEGAGERANTIPYASFGLVWKKFGEQLSGSKEAADDIDRILAQPIDAGDNGKSLFSLIIPNVSPYNIDGIVNLYRLTWKEEGDWDKRFMECLDWALRVLQRQIQISKDWIEAMNVVKKTYESAPDKRVIIFDKEYDLGREIIMRTLSDFKEVLYAVVYRSDAKNWQLVAITKDKSSFDLRKPLPELWGAKKDEELAEVTGMKDAVFCHRNLFMCVVGSKESAIILAQKAIEA